MVKEETALQIFAEQSLAERVETKVNPALSYLGRLDSEESRRTMRSALTKLAAMLSRDLGLVESLAFDEFPWWQLRYRHTAALRARLQVELQVRGRDKGKPYATATVNRHLVALRGVLEEAWRAEQMDGNDHRRAVDFERVKGYTLPRGRALSVVELAKLFDACADGTLLGLRDAAAIAVMARCGLRRIEVSRFDVVDLGASGRFVVRGKRNKQRLGWLRGDALAAVDEWVHARKLCVDDRVGGPLFLSTKLPLPLGPLERLGVSTVTDIVDRRAKLAGVTVAPHDLRRTFATELLNAGVDVITVSKLMGHDSVDITKGYDQRGELALERACELLPRAYRGPTR